MSIVSSCKNPTLGPLIPQGSTKPTCAVACRWLSMVWYTFCGGQMGACEDGVTPHGHIHTRMPQDRRAPLSRPQLCHQHTSSSTACPILGDGVCGCGGKNGGREKRDLVQRATVAMQHEMVHVAVQLLKTECAGLLIVDFSERFAQSLIGGGRRGDGLPHCTCCAGDTPQGRLIATAAGGR